MMMCMTARMRSFVCLLLLSFALGRQAAADGNKSQGVLATATDFMAHSPWKQKTVYASIIGIFLLGSFSLWRHKELKAKEQAEEAALYGSDEEFKEASEELKKVRKKYFAMRAVEFLLTGTCIVASIFAIKDADKEKKERKLLADELRLLAGPQHNASSDDNNDEQVHADRRVQLLGKRRTHGANCFDSGYTRLNRPTPSKRSPGSIAHKDYRDMEFIDPQVPSADAWNINYIKQMGPEIAFSQRFNTVFGGYRGRLEKRIRRFSFIVANYDQISTKLLRGYLDFADQGSKDDQAVRDTAKSVIEKELTDMKEELVALDKALKR